MPQDTSLADDGEVRNETGLGLFSDDGHQYIIRTGKLFEAGDYPDKNFSMTESDLDEAVRSFTPVQIDIEHSASVFDGKLGEVVGLERIGRELHGKVRVPRWLHNLFIGKELPVSATWDRGSKRLRKLALTTTPRITDAAIFSAMQENEVIDNKQSGRYNMDIKEFFKAFFSAAKEEGVLDGAEEQGREEGRREEEVLTESNFSNEEKAELERVRTELAEFKGRERMREAEAKADKLIAEFRAYPAERDALVGLFRQAIEDDGAGEASFSGESKSRVAALEATFALRPQHNLTSEVTKDTTAEQMAEEARRAKAERYNELRRLANLPEDKGN